jgi:LDH2 family malate/lactate/ureidoglycolate dehydrogenase
MSELNRIDSDALRDLCIALFRACRVDQEQANEVANNLIWSELVGRENFGLLRLPIYLERVVKGGLKCPCDPRFTDISDAISTLDADAGFGQYAANLATERAVSQARISGVGMVGVRNSNFFGTGAYFVNKIAEAGMVGLVMSNSFPKVTAHGGLTPIFGTNPLAFGAPRRNGEHLLFDMATSALAGSTIRECIEHGTPLPSGMAIDKDGNPITDPTKVADGALLPVAGAKGYGLSLFVEILAGVLTGAGVADGVSSMYGDVSAPGQNGHFVIAIDVSRFMVIEDFYARFETLVAAIKASHPINDVLLPGEIRWRNYHRNLEAGIPLGDTTRKVVEVLCRKHGIPVPWSPARQVA